MHDQASRAHRRRSGHLVGLLLLALVASWGRSARAAGGVEGLAQALARLRGEVESLSNTLEQKKADQRARMRSLATQKAELEVQLKREQVRHKELGRRRQQLRRRVAEQTSAQQTLKPVLPRLAARVRGAIATSLPFRREERLAEVRKLEQRAQQGLVGPEQAISQLWELVQDELRLGRESGLYQQVIPLGQSEQLVEVARVGMVLLFFRTRDGRYGLARRGGERWTFEVLSRKQHKSQVAALFDAFKKQIRTGFFTLPAALPLQGGAR